MKFFFHMVIFIVDFENVLIFDKNYATYACPPTQQVLPTTLRVPPNALLRVGATVGRNVKEQGASRCGGGTCCVRDLRIFFANFLGPAVWWVGLAARGDMRILMKFHIYG